MVGKSWLVAVSVVMVCGCDPFAPAQPETPVVTLETPLAATARDVPRLWALALSGRSPAKVNAVTSEQLVVSVAGNVLSSSGLTNCVVDRLFNRDSLVAPRWTSTWSPVATVSDTVRANIDYSVGKGEGSRVAHGSALWTMVRVNPSEWRLWRWDDDPASDSSMLAFCQGGIR